MIAVLNAVTHSIAFNMAQFDIMYLALMCLGSLMQGLLWPLVLSFSSAPTDRRESVKISSKSN